MHFENETNRSTRRTAALLGLSALALIACDGGGTTSPPATCTRDADCGAGHYCDLAAGASMDLDDVCYAMCLADCPFGDECTQICTDACGGTEPTSCADLCDEACAGGPPECTADCVASCEEDPPPSGADAGTSPPPPAGSGTCRPSSPPPAQDGGTEPPPPEPIDWIGTWNVRAVYTASCMWSSLGAPRTVNLDYLVTAQLSGSNSSITAVLAGDSGYTMTGTGNDTRLTLSGQFPGRDHNDNAATTVMRDNSVSIQVNEVVDHDTARGTIQGSYETSGGVSCDIQSGGTVELTR